jgi:hypothetical protein
MRIKFREYQINESCENLRKSENLGTRVSRNFRVCMVDFEKFILSEGLNG